jgi:hypothetical protein
MVRIEVLPDVLARLCRLGKRHCQDGLTDHSGKPPSPILRLHRSCFIRRRDRSKINTNANERVDSHAEPFSKRPLSSESHLSPHVEGLMRVFLLFRWARLFPRTDRRVGTLPGQSWVILSPKSSKVLPLLGFL